MCSEDKEASEQSVSADVMPQGRTLKAGLFPQEAHLCEVCGPMLRDSLRSVEHQETLHRQKPQCVGHVEIDFISLQTFYLQRKQRVGEKHCRNNSNRALFLKSCKFQASGNSFPFQEVGKDLLGSSGHLQQQAPHTREKPDRRAECAAAFHTVKNH